MTDPPPTDPAPGRGRRAKEVLAAAAAGLLVLAAADAAGRRVTLRADRAGDEAGFVGFQPGGEGLGYRVAHGASEIRFQALWPGAAASVAITVSAPETRRVRLWSADALVAEEVTGVSGTVLAGRARADDSGRLRLRVDNPRAGLVRVHQARLALEGPLRIPPGRLVQYAAAGLLAALLVSLALPRARRVRPAALAAGLLAAAAGVAAFRMHALRALPWALAGLAWPAAALALAGGLRRLGLPAPAARWVTLGMLLRLTVAFWPSHRGIDQLFHVHNIEDFIRGDLMVSNAPFPGRALPVPYPPALYALLFPFAWWRPDLGEPLVRLGMGACEASLPLLVYAVMRRSGAPAGPAASAAVAAALMPEGLLVIGKGIAANVFASFVGVLVVFALVTGAAAPVTTGLLALALLSHFGASLCLLPFLLAWWLLQGARRELSWGAVAARMGCLAGALAVAWAAYYRDVFALATGAAGAVGGHLATAPGASVHWVRLGKILQDLLLKFGGVPVVLAAVGLAAGRLEPRLRGLVTAWLGVGMGLAALAVLTPVSLRFEHFVMPPLAMAAGHGAEELRRRGHGRLVAAGWGACFLLFALSALFIMSGRYELISVILESRRWPFPFRL